MSVTCETSQEVRFWLKEVWENIAVMSVTCETFQEEMS